MAARPPAPATARLELIAVPGLPDFAAGDELAAAIVAATERAHLRLIDGDVVVVAQKVVSKCEGRHRALADVTPSARARDLAAVTDKDARLVELILSESTEVLRAAPGVLIVSSRHGHVMANAGIDSSNVAPDSEGHVLLLPADPDLSARLLRDAIGARARARVAVIINDSWGRAWRNGTIGHAVGCAGLPALWDRRGEPDMHGRELRSTEIGLADEIAAAASLVMGAAAERQPVVVVRGLVQPHGEGPATDLVRARSRDLFR